MDKFEFQTVGIGKQHRVVSVSIFGIFRRRVENGRANVAQKLMQTVHVFATLGAPGQMVQAGCVTVVAACPSFGFGAHDAD